MRFASLSGQLDLLLPLQRGGALFRGEGIKTIRAGDAGLIFGRGLFLGGDRARAAVAKPA